MSVRSARALVTALSILTLASIAPVDLAAQERPFIGVRYDADRNRVLLEIAPDRLDRDLLYQTVLATGGGVGALGLDRGQTGGSAVIRFERRGRRVLVRRDNVSVRAIGGDEAAQRAAREAFPYSVIAN